MWNGRNSVRWLITGGCGFIGRNLIGALLRDGFHAIRIIDNLSVGNRDDLAQVCRFSENKSVDINPLSDNSVQLIVGDTIDEPLAHRLSNGMDVIVHLAANAGVEASVRDPRFDCMTNVIGTLNYLEAARHNDVKRFIFASSGAPIGECAPPIHEEVPAHPVSPYGASKLAGEGYCSAYYRTFGLETVVLRFGNVYGPYSDHKSSVIARFIQQALAGETFAVYGDGTQTRDFIIVSELIRAIMIAAQHDATGGEIFQIASGCETSINNLVEILKKCLTDHGIDKPELRYGTERKGDVRKNRSDITKAETILGWSCNTGLADGIEETVKWFLQKDR